MKTLIVYAKAGAGHRRAAEAVLHAFQRHGLEKDVVLIDCLDYCNSWFKDFYPNVYIFLVRFLSPVWAFIYYALENRVVFALIKPFRRLSNYLVSRGFVEYLKREGPKVVISTQFFASEVVAALKRKGKLDATLISVVTDFGAHTFWESEDVDIFVAASEETKQDLLKRRIPEQKIRVLGIPIEALPKQFEKSSFIKESGLSEDRFKVLIAGGGFGVGPIKELVATLDQLNEEIKQKVQLLVVCSKNKQLSDQMQNLVSGLNVNAKVFGFVPDLYKMMLISDVIISKSGGLTTSESLAAGLPMIIIAPIPGQESKNCDLLVDKGAAIRIEEAIEAKKVITELVSRPEKVTQMRQNCAVLSRPDSAEDVVNLATKNM